MKKALSLILSLVIAASAVLSVSAEELTLTEGGIARTDKAPTIDGTITAEDNWGEPFITIKNPGTEHLGLCAADHPEYLTDPDLIPSETNIYIRWDEKNLYYGAMLVQEKRSNTYPAVNYWEGDCVSFNIKSTLDTDSKTRFITGLSEDGIYVIHESTEDGAVASYDDSQFTVTRDEKNKLTTYEAYFPWEYILPDNEAHPGRTVKAGDVFYFRDLYMPATSPETKNPVDFNIAGITEAGNYNYWKITLLADGNAAAQKTEAEEIVEVPTVEEPIAEAPVAATVAAEEPAASTAPQTFDIGVIAAISALVSLAGYAASKKR